MKLYKLRFSMSPPSVDTEDKFMAEIAALPGCRAWGDTADEALLNLQSVAAAFIESYNEWGDQLPTEVKSASIDTAATDELLVAV